MPLQEHALYTVLARYYDYIYAQYLRDIVPKYVDATVEAFKKFVRKEVRDVRFRIPYFICSLFSNLDIRLHTSLSDIF